MTHQTHETGAYDGDPLQEILHRMRRVETRVTNFMRANGQVPGCNPHDPLPGAAVYDNGQVYVTRADVTLADILTVAVLGSSGKSGVVNVILHNQLVGVVNVQGKH